MVKIHGCGSPKTSFSMRAEELFYFEYVYYYGGSAG